MKTAFVYPPAWAPWAPSYAMALLKAEAEQRRHIVTALDLNIDFHNAVSDSDKKLWRDEYAVRWQTEESVREIMNNYSDFLDNYVKIILSEQAPLCAFSVNSASSLFARLFARKIKERSPSTFILFGGPDCFRSEAGLEILKDPAVDAICTGEGDKAWPDFLDYFEKNDYRIDGLDVKGFCYNKKDGTVADHGDPELVTKLDALPFAAYDSVDFSKYTLKNRICLMMSRGCINRCSYCSEGPNFKMFRYRSPENLLSEVKQHIALVRKKSNQIPHINFSDSLIDGKPPMLEAFCDLVIREGLQFTWGGMALIRKELTPEFLKKMKRAGCVEICWGLESGSARVLDLMRKKHFTPESAEEMFRAANELGFHQYTNIIVGFPGETEELFLESAQFLLRIKPYFSSIGLPLLTLRKNSYLYDHYQQYGVENLDPEQWKTTDNSNTYELRIARRNLLQSILQDKFFDQGRYDDKKARPANKEREISAEPVVKQPQPAPGLPAQEVAVNKPQSAGTPQRPHAGPELYAVKKNNIDKLYRLIDELKAGNRSPEIRNLPAELYVELTKRCNLDCIMCSHGIEHKDGSNGNGSGIFPEELFPAFDELLPAAAMVYTVGLGEPLLHPGLTEFIARCRKQGAFVWTNSNGMALTEELSQKLVEAGLSRFVFSISAGNKQSYEHYHRGAAWERVWKNMESLNAARLSKGERWPQIFTNFVVMDENIKELPVFMAQTLPFDLAGVSVKPIVNMHGILEKRENAPRVRHYGNGDREFLLEAKEFTRVLGCEFEDHAYKENYRNDKARGICLHPFSTLMVNSKGDVYPCGQGESVGGPELLLGNIRKQSLLKIWNGDVLRELRKNIISGTYGDGCKECIAKQLCRLHNDKHDTTAGILCAAEIGCSTPGPVRKNGKGNNGHEKRASEANARLWPVAPPREMLKSIKRRNFYRYMLSLIQNRETVFNTPIEIFLETSNACNLSCIFCATQTHETRPSGPSAIMSSEIMKSVRAFLPGTAAISLHGFGEPLLNKQMIAAAASSVDYLLQVDFFTNGMLMNEQAAAMLVNAKVPGFTVSISTANPERYEKFYHGGTFDRLVKNLRFLKEEKQRRNSDLPRVMFNAIAMRDTLPDLPGLVELAAELGIGAIELKPLVTYANLDTMHEQRIQFDPDRDGPILAAAHRIAKEKNVILSTALYEATKPSCAPTAPVSSAAQSPASAPALPRLAKPCPLVFRTMYIRSNGQVKPCCFASDEPHLSLGDVTRQTVHEIWNGDKYRELRRAHREGLVPAACAHCVEFKLAPPSDATKYWLGNSGIRVYDPLNLVQRMTELEQSVAELKASARKWELADNAQEPDNTLLQTCIQFLTSLNAFVTELNHASSAFLDLTPITTELATYSHGVEKIVQPCAMCEEFRTVNLIITKNLTPVLGILNTLLGKCSTALTACLEQAALQL